MLRRHDWGRQSASPAVPASEDAFAFQQRKFIRTGLSVLRRNRGKPGDRAIMVGNENGLTVAHLFNQGAQLILGGGY